MKFEQLIEAATQTMLQTGNLMPMIQLELEQHVIMLHLDILNDHQTIPEQGGILARLGWDHCHEHTGEKPISAGFYSEVWQITNPENKSEAMMPVVSRRRKEMIMIQYVTTKEAVQTVAREVIRDYKKRVIDVGPIERPKTQQPWQIGAFWQGCLDAQRPEQEVLDEMTTRLEKNIARLDPATRRKFEDYFEKWKKG